MNAPVDPATLAALGASDAAAPTQRQDGWTTERRQTFLAALAEGHTVEAACAHVGLSVASAYALRRRAGGEAFALGWRAATLLARDRLADILTSRAIDGQIDTYTRADGQTVTRHRYDNRLATAMLTRLDRLAEEAPFATIDRGSYARTLTEEDAARTVAIDFADYLDLVDADAGAARDFVSDALADRTPQLPQLRRREGEDAAEEDAAFPADEALYWRHESGDFYCTDDPPPPGFTGRTSGRPHAPGYWREATPEEAEDWAGIDAERAAAEQECRALAETLRRAREML